MIDETVVKVAQAYVDAFDGDLEQALLKAVADQTQRSFHRLPPVSKAEWPFKPIHKPLDIEPPEQEPPL